MLTVAHIASYNYDPAKLIAGSYQEPIRLTLEQLVMTEHTIADLESGLVVIVPDEICNL